METIASLLVGIVIPYFVNKCKKLGLSGRQGHLVIAIVLAFGYTGYQTLAPEPIKENVYQFVTQASVTGVLIYEFFIKKLYTKNEK